MSSNRTTLIEHEGHLYVQVEASHVMVPKAYRLWFRVHEWAEPAHLWVRRNGPPVGAELRTHIGTTGADYSSPEGHTFRLERGGATPCDHKWTAPVPPPKGATVQSSYLGLNGTPDPGCVAWRNGQWVRGYKTRQPKEFPIPWDRLEWQEETER